MQRHVICARTILVDSPIVWQPKHRVSPRCGWHVRDIGSLLKTRNRNRAQPCSRYRLWCKVGGFAEIVEDLRITSDIGWQHQVVSWHCAQVTSRRGGNGIFYRCLLHVNDVPFKPYIAVIWSSCRSFPKQSAQHGGRSRLTDDANFSATTMAVRGVPLDGASSAWLRL